MDIQNDKLKFLKLYSDISIILRDAVTNDIIVLPMSKYILAQKCNYFHRAFQFNSLISNTYEITVPNIHSMAYILYSFHDVSYDSPISCDETFILGKILCADMLFPNAGLYCSELYYLDLSEKSMALLCLVMDAYGNKIVDDVFMLSTIKKNLLKYDLPELSLLSKIFDNVELCSNIKNTQLAAFVNSSNKIEIIYLDIMQTIITQDVVASKIVSMAFSPDKILLLVIHENGNIVIWNTITGKKIETEYSNAVNVIAVCFSPCNKKFAILKHDFCGLNIIFNNVQHEHNYINSNIYISVFSGYSENLQYIKYSSNDQYIIYSSDKMTYILNTTKKITEKIPVCNIIDTIFSEDNTNLFIISTNSDSIDREIYVTHWNLKLEDRNSAKRSELINLTLKNNEKVYFTFDKKYVVVLGDDNITKYKLGDGKCKIEKLDVCHESNIFAFTTDGKHQFYYHDLMLYIKYQDTTYDFFMNRVIDKTNFILSS